jgi:hypothetical protein
MNDHCHDWRVDPNQIIISLGDEQRVRVACAVEGCERTATVTTKGSLTFDPQRVETWRPFQFKSDDVIVES